jgi:hypothetical protein
MRSSIASVGLVTVSLRRSIGGADAVMGAPLRENPARHRPQRQAHP